MVDLAVSRDPKVTVKDLAEAASTHATITNRAWLATLVAALILLLPSPTAKDTSDRPCFDLPFAVVKCVREDVFFPVGFVLLASFVVGFASAHAQQMRVHDRVQRTLDNAPSSDRELFDVLRISSVSRVAPLAELPREIPRWLGKSAYPKLKTVARVFYWLLRIVVALVLFGVPGYSLWTSFLKALALQPRFSFAFWTVFVVAGLAILVTAVADIAYSIRTSKHVGTTAT